MGLRYVMIANSIQTRSPCQLGDAALTGNYGLADFATPPPPISIEPVHDAGSAVSRGSNGPPPVGATDHRVTEKLPSPFNAHSAGQVPAV